MATLNNTNRGVGGFGSTGIQPIVQSSQSKDTKGQKKKSSLSPTPGSQLRQVTNLVNMVVGVEPGPSSMSWMARKSTYQGEVVFPDCVLGGTTVEAGGFILGMVSSSKTPRRRTLELAARIGQQPLRLLVDSGSTGNYIDAWECTT